MGITPEQKREQMILEGGLPLLGQSWEKLFPSKQKRPPTLEELAGFWKENRPNFTSPTLYHVKGETGPIGSMLLHKSFSGEFRKKTNRDTAYVILAGLYQTSITHIIFLDQMAHRFQGAPVDPGQMSEILTSPEKYWGKHGDLLQQFALTIEKYPRCFWEDIKNYLEKYWTNIGKEKFSSQGERSLTAIEQAALISQKMARPCGKSCREDLEPVGKWGETAAHETLRVTRIFDHYDQEVDGSFPLDQYRLEPFLNLLGNPLTIQDLIDMKTIPLKP